MEPNFPTGVKRCTVVTDPIQTMLVVFSNRLVDTRNTDHTLFGETINSKGPAEFRVATAEFDAGAWKLELLDETKRDKEPPSSRMFKRVIDDTKSSKISNKWIFFIHGFNQSSDGALDEARGLAEVYDANIFCFLWPSNAGGFIISEYRNAQSAAKLSAVALDRIFGKLAEYHAQVPINILGRSLIDINLLAHSLGNYVLENYAYNPQFSKGITLFENVVLHQADVDSARHSIWLENSTIARHAYVTHNIFDNVLRWSETINPPRLGLKVSPRDQASDAYYFDFSGVDNVSGNHNLATSVQNLEVQNFFKQTLHGQPISALSSFSLDANDGVYRL